MSLERKNRPTKNPNNTNDIFGPSKGSEAPSVDDLLGKIDKAVNESKKKREKPRGGCGCGF